MEPQCGSNQTRSALGDSRCQTPSRRFTAARRKSSPGSAFRRRWRRRGDGSSATASPEKSLEFFARLPLLAIGTVDECGRPWASALAGKPGFAQAIDPLKLEVKARPVYGDPLNKALIDGADIAALGLDFETHGRFRVNGKIGRRREDGFEIRVRQAFPNCPQYIQAREYDRGCDIETIGGKKAVRRGETLNRAEAAIIAGSDTLFIASQFSAGDDDWSRGVDVSHRGGKPGFVIVAHESLLLFPDYAGNCMFATLGNIQADPRCGLLFIDFDTGNTLQLTGEAEILWEREHVCRFPGAERVVSFHLEETIHVERALPMTWRFQGFHPILEKLETDGLEEPAPEPRAPMTLKSVNVSMPTEVRHDGKTVTTGIFKGRVEGRVMVRRLNLDGDGQADLWGHGGAFRAVYAYSHENYDYWARELGRNDFAVGQFGENFTVEGMLDDEVCVGDVLPHRWRRGRGQPTSYSLLQAGAQDGHRGFPEPISRKRSGGVLFPRPRGRRGWRGRRSGARQEGLTRHDRPGGQQPPLFRQGKPGSDQAGPAHPGACARLEGFVRGAAGEGGNIDRRPERIAQFRGRANGAGKRDHYVLIIWCRRTAAPLPGFLPGQFLTLELDIPGQPGPVLRTYSLSDSPNPESYRLSIKRETAPVDEPGAAGGAVVQPFP